VLNSQPAVAATVGTAFTGTVATFSDTSATLPGPTAYVANINWGDGHITNGLITANNRGGFTVSGTNTYASAGLFPISVDVEKLDAAGTAISLTNTSQVAAASTATTLAVSPSSTEFGQPLTLTATVTPAPGSVPGGLVVFMDGANAIGTGTLTNNGTNSTATFTTSSLPAGQHNFTAVFPGNFSFTTSTSASATASVSSNVTPQFQIVASKITKKSGKFRQTLLIKNTGGNTIAGPVFFVFNGLPTKSKLVNASGTSTPFAPSPYLIIPLGTANTFVAGQTVGLSLTFTAPNAKKIAYTNLIEAGTAVP
jgi:hypothetical protein